MGGWRSDRAPAPVAVVGAGESWQHNADRRPSRRLLRRRPPSGLRPFPASSQGHRRPLADRTPRLERLGAPAAASRRSEPTAQEALYDNAWDSMRAGDFEKAAAGFAAVVGVSPRGPLADEGAFWRAVALARAGKLGAGHL